MIKSNKLCKSSTPNSSKTEFLLTGLSKQLVKTHNSSLNTIHSALNLGFTSDKPHLILNRPYLCPNPAITIFVNFAVSIHTSIPKQILPLPLFTPSLNTAILSITTSQSLKSRASNRSTTLMLLSKPPNPFISLPSHTLCTGFDNVVLYGAPSTSCSVSTTMQQRLCCRCQNEPMRSLYSRNYIGCPLNSASDTRQLCSLSRFSARQRQHISTNTSRYVDTLKTLGHQRLQSCSSRSP